MPVIEMMMTAKKKNKQQSFMARGKPAAKDQGLGESVHPGGWFVLLILKLFNALDRYR